MKKMEALDSKEKELHIKITEATKGETPEHGEKSEKKLMNKYVQKND